MREIISRLSRKSSKSRKGFTLIEVLVTVVIISIILSFVIANLTSFQKRARDTTRKNDLRVMANALESYSNATGGYVKFNENFVEVIKDYTREADVPRDPKTGFNYGYESDELGSYYRLYAKLENCDDPEILADYKGDSQRKALCQSQSVPYNYGIFSNTAPIASGGPTPTTIPLLLPTSTPVPTAAPGGPTPTRTPTPTPGFAGACTDGTDDTVFSSNMALCTVSISIQFAQAPQLCSIGWHVCTFDEYFANNGTHFVNFWLSSSATVGMWCGNDYTISPATSTSPYGGTSGSNWYSSSGSCSEKSQLSVGSRSKADRLYGGFCCH